MTTNLPFLRWLVAHPLVRAGRTTTAFLTEHPPLSRAAAARARRARGAARGGSTCRRRRRARRPTSTRPAHEHGAGVGQSTITAPMPGTVIKVLVEAGARVTRASAARRARGDEDGDAARLALRRDRARRPRRRGRPGRRRRSARRARGVARSARSGTDRGASEAETAASATPSAARPASQQAESFARLKELLELHRGAHVALDLELAGHVGARRVLLAGDDLLEGLLGGLDRRVGVAAALGDRDLAVVDVDLPLAGAVDVEDVRVASCPRSSSVGPRLEVLEELLDGVGHLELLVGIGIRTASRR